MDIELTYRKGLLRDIGGVPVTYGKREWLDSTPRALGPWPLEYQRFSSTLRAVGSVAITYRRWSGRPVTVGQWSCEHGRFGGSLRRIGPYELRYDQFGSRVRAVGPLEIFYDRLGSRPIRLRLDGEGESLSDDLLLALFLVLFWQKQNQDAAAQARR
ncbi:hypothetical protein E2C00_17085 [Streptomyces sp. WAC05374]|uniref:hypothetical protein n=1 Tax=Streptomyces sp. WAC05374 TaxID=2487420 RepID=UPI000F87F635|nr:hypothetical protein [Streptomyces sp. WAC05374]RST16537.1 hypothetical protein EF905_12050 [Streptomyces sp. WAC05374]TDF54636.1 hypothetical protein E2C00_17085 [Streptomyces sp. WAC05374]TDF56271.1 hypothetical protein E2C02_12540 [Streptomyces sp. WAC05374]